MVSKWPVEVNMVGEYIEWQDGTRSSWSGIGSGQLKNQNRLNQIAAVIQRDYLDKITPETNFDPEDQYRNSTDAELLARYGNRVFRDGNDNIVDRSTTISLAWEAVTGRIVPTVTKVR